MTMDRVHYRITVEGEIGPRFAAAFDGRRSEPTMAKPRSSTNHTYTGCSAGSPISD
jgi:hypothetical protein